MRLLGTFARHRDIEHLLELLPETEDTAGFAPLDATAVLNLAALTRPVEEAATLAIELWTMESGRRGTPPRLTDSIVHDVTAQRIVPEVAVFIAECRRRGQADLASKAVVAFALTSSGRTNFDQAMLYVSLSAGGCPEEAAALLRLIAARAEAEAAQPAAGPAGQVGIVAALHHLSPSETIVEDWVDGQMERADQEAATVALVASLLIAERDGDRELARHVGGSWEPHRLIDLCEDLSGRAHGHPGRRLAVLGSPAQDRDRIAGRAQACLALVRGHAAARSDKELVEIIRLWHKSGELTGTLRDLLADIVAGGADSPAPRPIEFLDSLQRRLKRRRVPGRCRAELRFAAAVQLDGRETGAEVATLLGRVGRRELRHAAQAINRQLTADLISSQPDIEREAQVEKFVDYVHGLQDLPRAAALTFLALRALSDPGAGQAPSGWVVADIAARAYAGIRADIGFDLLERCLENEQWLSDKDAADIITRVRLGAMHDDKRWYPLLSATVGRWADARRRDGVVAALRRLPHGADADAIIRSVQ